MSQTTAKDATINSTAINVDRCCLVCCCIDITESGTAIDVAFNNAITAKITCLSIFFTNVYSNVTTNLCCFTTSTTIDIVAHGTILHAYLGVTINVGSITTAIDVRNLIAAASILNLHQGVFID